MWEGIQSVSSTLPKTNISFTKKLKMQFYRHPVLTRGWEVENCASVSAIAAKLVYLHCASINKFINIWLRLDRSLENEKNKSMRGKCRFNLWPVQLFKKGCCLNTLQINGLIGSYSSVISFFDSLECSRNLWLACCTNCKNNDNNLDIVYKTQ